MAICYNLTDSHFLLSVFFYILGSTATLLALMIKKPIAILVLILAACNEAANKKPVTKTASTKPHTDTIAIAPPTGAPITPLPFGPAGGTATTFYKKDAWFYFRVMGKGDTSERFHETKYTPSWPLPPIVKYTHAADGGRDSCYNGERLTSVDSLFSITKYRVRLPDHKGFEVYYMTGDAKIDPVFPPHCETCEMNYGLYGYLIFYERATQTAHLLPAYYSYYIDSQHTRMFYIDSNYRIFLYDEQMTDGDNGDPSITGGPVDEVTINSKGEFTIKKAKG